MKKNTRNSVFIALLTIAAITLALTISFKSKQLDFDSNRWQNDVAARIRMLNSLTKSHHLNGMNREELISLLGKPDFKNKTTFIYRMPSNEFQSVFALLFAHDVVSETRVEDSGHDFYKIDRSNSASNP